MNLTFGHFAKLLVGGVLGAGTLFAISYFVPLGSFGDFERVLNLQQIGLIFGGLAGMAISIFVLVIKDSHRPETGAAANFTSINGTGSRFIGKTDIRQDESYLTTEWFCMLWIPFFPVCTYRVIKIKERSNLIVAWYMIQEKYPVRIKDLAKGYSWTLAIGFAIASAVMFFRWIET